MTFTWLCDKDMLGLQAGSGFPNLAEALVAAGVDVATVATDGIDESLVPHGLVAGWGSRPFLERIRKTFPATRLDLFDQAETHRYDLYAPHLRRLMLNGLYEVMPLERAFRIAATSDRAGLFIKPAFASKRFTGTSLTKDNLGLRAEKLAHVPLDTVCIVAPLRAGIRAEYRFVIADGEVVTGSQYVFEGRKDVRIDVLSQAALLAQEIARRPWQAAPFYVCDVGVLEDGQALMVELNPFSSCGLYACDTTKIADAVKAHFLRTAPDFDQTIDTLRSLVG